MSRPAELPRLLPLCILFTAACAFLLLILSAFALLREDPLFWQNAGGWPVWLRELVLYTFYPLFGLLLMLLTTLALICVSGIGLGQAKMWVRIPTLLLALWLGAVGVMVAGNNVANLVTGRPLHWHAGYVGH